MVTKSDTRIIARSGSVTVTRTLYGDISTDRYRAEQRDAQRRAEMLDHLNKPYPKIKIYPEDRL